MLNKIRRKLLDKLANKEGVVCVPRSWQKEYVELAGKVVAQRNQINEIIVAYNNLLMDSFEKAPMTELKQLARDADLKITKDMDRQTIINIIYNDYCMKKY